ncbi:hypothetical protein E2I00_011734, partial [Balaenoptera physalus]
KARALGSAQHHPVPLGSPLWSPSLLLCLSELGAELLAGLSSTLTPHPITVPPSGGWAEGLHSKLLALALGSQPGGDDVLPLLSPLATALCTGAVAAAAAAPWLQRNWTLPGALPPFTMSILLHMDHSHLTWDPEARKKSQPLGRGFFPHPHLSCPVLLGCPEEAAAVWESLQQEARRAPHPDNLHTLCSTPVRLQERGAGPETNQETLRATAPAPTLGPEPPLLAAALALACLLVAQTPKTPPPARGEAARPGPTAPWAGGADELQPRSLPGTLGPSLPSPERSACARCAGP